MIYKMSPVPIDKWQIMDVFFAAVSMGAVLVISGTPTDFLLDDSYKHKLSYFIVFVSCVQYLRVYNYLLMIPSVSKMLLTLYMMILDTIAFLFLLAIYMIWATAVFSTLFQDTKGGSYKDLFTTFLTLWNGLFGGY